MRNCLLWCIVGFDEIVEGWDSKWRLFLLYDEGGIFGNGVGY